MMQVTAVLLLCFVCGLQAWNFNGTSWSGSLSTKNPKLCDPSVKQYAGYYTVEDVARDHVKKHYFYWAFEARKNPEKAPTLLWMTGGPGCSSMLALYSENGPCQMDLNTGKIHFNPFGWNENANLIYVDQPPGTGYSYTKTGGFDHNEKQVSEDMYHFLLDFFKSHPTWLKNEFYIFAESYGGHYAPAVANRVYMGNKAGGNPKLPLVGVGIGNGLTEPLIQYGYYAELAYNYSITKIGHPIISLAAYDKMTRAWPHCRDMISRCQQHNLACLEAYDYCNSAMFTAFQETGTDVYNIEKKCNPPPLCLNLKYITDYLNSPAVKNDLGIPTEVKWETCNFNVNGKFKYDWMHDFQQDLVPLLENGIRVLIYAGDLDFICNWLGNQAWSLNLPWTGHDEFNAAAFKTWSVNGTAHGQARTAKGFTFLRVFNAGHMVPHNQPAASQAMLDQFMAGHKFP